MALGFIFGKIIADLFGNVPNVVYLWDKIKIMEDVNRIVDAFERMATELDRMRYDIGNLVKIKEKSEFKVGQWVVSRKDGHIGRISKIDKYAFLLDDEMPGGYLLENADGYCEWRLATKEEIESHLKKICDEKYAKDGWRFYLYDFDRDMVEYANEIGDNIGVVYSRGEFVKTRKKRLPKTKDELVHIIQHIVINAQGLHDDIRLSKWIESELRDYED
jgi:hypothetical protein